MRLLRAGRRPGEAELLAAVRRRLVELGWPAEGLSDGYLRAGVRRVSRALDEGRLPAARRGAGAAPVCGGRVTHGEGE